MKRAVPLAVGVGLLVGLGGSRFAAHWSVPLGTAAVYAGAAYFYFAFDLSLLDRAPRFDDRTDRLGYGVGLFGVSVTPILTARYVADDAATAGIVATYVGVIAFLTLSERARRLDETRE